MRTYLLLKERAAAFRADPEVQEALAARRRRRARHADARRRRVLAGACSPTAALDDFDAERPAERGFGFVQLDQLAIEHLIGLR